MTNWTPDDLDTLGGADEIEITTLRPDGSARRWTPIWSVRTGDDLYVRSYRGQAGAWYRRARGGEPTRVRVRGHREHDVTVEVPGEVPGEAATVVDQDAVDAAYRAKYARFGTTYLGPMVAPAARAATLRITPLTA
ncbi:DUF2255 family protein [Kineococcus sp. TBRC 1896]|uniref:DUF2255 family protein n=1 Tax=Kineococcus mangrovi TaxID=1660183 RepID=A0ABV4I8A0_9ACTN